MFQLDNSTISTDYCVIGAGLVGLSIAYEIVNQGSSVILIDSGYDRYDSIVQQLNDGSSGPFGNWPHTNYSLQSARIRAIGGTSIVWGGWCRDLSEWDFNSNSRCRVEWPFRYEELEPHYQVAKTLLGIDTEVPAEDQASEFISPLIKSTIDIASNNVSKNIVSFLLTSDKFQLVAGYTLIELSINGDTITKALFTSSGSRGRQDRLAIEATHFILSAGGIENARLLLTLLPRNLKEGLPIGQGFMEHPQLYAGRFYPSSGDMEKYLRSICPPLNSRWSFKLWQQHRDSMARHYGAIQLPYDLQKKYELGNASLVFRQTNVYSYASLYWIRHVLLTQSISGCGPLSIHRLTGLLSDASRILAERMSNILSTTPPFYHTLVQSEQYPNNSNRISLTADKDAHNVPKVHLTWNIYEDDIHTITGTLTQFGRIAKSKGLGQFSPEPALMDKHTQKQYLLSNVLGIGHHMGTTRMGTNDDSSVCNEYGQFWRLRNLSISGSSLFPRSGVANPTLTAIALGIRNTKKLLR